MKYSSNSLFLKEFTPMKRTLLIALTLVVLLEITSCSSKSRYELQTSVAGGSNEGYRATFQENTYVIDTWTGAVWEITGREWRYLGTPPMDSIKVK